MISNIAISGLNSAFTKLRTTANNIANSETPGFKQQRANQVESFDGGVKIAQISPPTYQGNSQNTNDKIDLENTAVAQSEQKQASNVSLEEQLTKLISIKQEAQANAKIIKTEDEMLGTLFNDKA